MKEKSDRRWIFTLIAVIFDSLSICGAMLASYYLRLKTGLIPFFSKGEPVIPPLSYYIKALFIIIPIWIIASYYLGLYRDWDRRRVIDDFFNIVVTAIITVLVSTGFAFFYRAFSYSRLVLIIFILLVIIFATFSRLLIFWLMRFFWKKGKFVKRCVVVGKSEVGKKLIEKLKTSENVGYNLIGLASISRMSDEEGERWASEDDQDLYYIGSLNTLQMWVRDYNVDEIFIVREIDRPKILKALNEAEVMGCSLRIVSDILGIMRSKVYGEDRLGIPMFSLKRLPLNAIQKFLKRTLDLIASLLFLILASPVMLVSAILIKATSRGPVLYKQERVGLDGKEFTMYKFRSMKEKAEEETGAVWAKKDDPRRTFIGKILRKTSLDELPQLFNVLKGEMSIVGPRPERPVFVKEFAKRVPRYLDRHKIPCGITGWAQVNGLRGDTSLEERIEYDIYYIENWSLLFDVKIIILTFFNLFAPEKV
jgi:exopolysaccharide biosynthesis polyprenyl glycosylphosphotransferase